VREAEDQSTLSRARKLFAGLSRSLDGEIDRQQAVLEIETDDERVKALNALIRDNRRTLQTVLDLEARLMRVADMQQPGEGVIDLAQARAEITRRLARLAG
jgi:hypothetical protein